MTPLPTATVVCCVRNGEATLPRQLAALRTQDYELLWELVFVDNGSTDATRVLLQRCVTDMPNARLLDEPRRGLSVARNTGVCAARSTRIACCDADDEVAPAWLRNMLGALDRFDVVGGALEHERLNDRRALRSNFHQTSGLPTALGRHYAVGANFGFTKQVWNAISGFDEAFEAGFDDVDFCLRAQDAGYSIGFQPAAVVHYRLRDTLRQVAQQHFRFGRAEERLVAKRNGLGDVDGRLLRRWRRLAVNGKAVATESRGLFQSPSERRESLETLAYWAGRMAELAHTSVRARPRRR